MKALVRKKRQEVKYYDSILRWLFENGYYVGQGMVRRGKPFWYKNLGAKARADVVGVKNVGNEYVDNIEIGVVEVKDAPIKLRYIEQAHGYSIFAHKCYLATPYEFSEENKSMANNFGVGLLKINKEKKRRREFFGIQKYFFDVEEVLSPQTMEPNEAEMKKFLATLSIVQCTICQCYVFHWVRDEKLPTSVKTLIRGKQLSEMVYGAGFPFEVKPPKGYRTYRYICLDCLNQLPTILKAGV